MSTNPYESPETVGYSAERKSFPLRTWLIQGLVVIAAIGILIALLLPNVRHSGEAARRIQCSNNLHQIAIALLEYQDEYRCLPPAYTVDEDGNPLHSWRTLILPYVEQKTLYDKIDLSKPWDDPANLEAFNACPKSYQCPSSRNTLREGHTTYLAVVVPGGCFLPAQSRELAEVTDQHNQTLMLIEVSAEEAVPWMSPRDFTNISMLQLAEDAAHSSGTNAAFVGGNVQFLSKSLDPKKLAALISIAGNDDAASALD